MAYEPPTIDQAIALLSDPSTPAEKVAEIAAVHPQLHAAVAAHPNTAPDVLAWLSGSGDPIVQEALRQRPAAAPAPEAAATLEPAVTKPVAKPKRTRLYLLLGGGAVALAAVLAVVLIFTPVLSWLGLAKGSDWGDPPQASYTNGARLSWTLDLDQQFPGQHMTFSFGPNLDDAWHWSRYAPLEVGTTWIAPYYIDSSVSANNAGLIGIERATGKVLWHTSSDRVGDCADSAIDGSLPCLADQTEDQARLVMVNANTGAVQTVSSMGRVYGIAAAGRNIITAAENTVGVSIVSYTTDGSVVWRQNIDANGLADLTNPVEVSGDYVKVNEGGGITVLRVSDGAVALRGSGSGELLPSGVFLSGPDFSQVEQPSAELKVKLISTRPRLVGTAGSPSLFLESDNDSEPLQWCPNLDPNKCQAIPSSGGFTATEVVEVDAKPRYFVGGGTSSFGTYDLTTGAKVSDLEARTDSGYPTWFQHNQVGLMLNESQALELFNTITGATIGTANLPGWVPLASMPGDRMVVGHSSDERRSLTRISMFAPSAAAGSGITGTVAAAPTQPSSPETTTTSTSTLPSCPSGTIQLAYATFTNGWVLVCGVDAATPTWWSSQEGGNHFESSSVTYSPTESRYTATFSDGRFGWLNHAPGVYGRTGSGSTVEVQQSVGVIWFVQIEGGGGQSSSPTATGPYGIPIPQRTPEDQVRYLAALLDSSAQARAELQPAVIAVRECASTTGYANQITTISSVADNRSQLINALATAPVDLVPDGTELVSELRSALQYSLKADQAYLAWAKAVDANGCGSGSEDEGAANSKKAGSAKEIFVKHWNDTIASNFSVAKVSREKL